MSDQSQGPGWWLASDGKWYPPESAPAPTTQPEPPLAYADGGEPPKPWFRRPWVILAAVAVVLLFVGIAAALSPDDEDNATSGDDITTTTESTTTTLRDTTTTVDRCEAATEEGIDAIGVLLDRVESVGSDLDALDQEAVSEVMSDVGREVGTACGASGLGGSVSAILVYLSDESTNRPVFGQLFADAMIRTFCDLDYELSTQARLVCKAAG